MRVIFVFVLSVFLFACSSHPVLPKASDIKVSRDEAAKDCKSFGSIEGRTTNVKGTAEDVLEDLKQEAVKKGANFVKIETQGAQGTAIRGQAFYCP